ncbi:DUF6503 family protein [Sungkyunkwania multivorans]|uniref:DUF6503 family protein n=1 Tax=Sungkyunkwania multivorans TaxID=1173618 RepID=A0ABW3CXN9_9FLAO
MNIILSRSKIFFIVAMSIVLFQSCKENESTIAQEIIDKAIERVGGDSFFQSCINFTFRDEEYRAFRADGVFALERLRRDSLGTIRDVLSNNDFKRYLNDSLVKVPDSMKQRYANSINSVHYFSVLPFGLNDAAVQKRYLGNVEINDKQYYKVQVTFAQEGGGDDFDDVFIYWFETNTYSLDYLAYEFHVNGGGMRFREAFNEKEVGGFKFVDYNNYKPMDEEVALSDLDSLFQRERLQLLSKIVLQDLSTTCDYTY